VTVPNKSEHIRGIALELAAHPPVDTDDAMAVMDHMHELIEWRRGNVTPAPTGGRWIDREPPKLTVVPFKE
jgi:hypothetical protein